MKHHWNIFFRFRNLSTRSWRILNRWVVGTNEVWLTVNGGRDFLMLWADVVLKEARALIGWVIPYPPKRAVHTRQLIVPPVASRGWTVRTRENRHAAVVLPFLTASLSLSLSLSLGQNPIHPHGILGAAPGLLRCTRTKALSSLSRSRLVPLSSSPLIVRHRHRHRLIRRPLFVSCLPLSCISTL